MSSGASPATIAWEVGTQSISPVTNTSSTTANIATEPLSSRNRNEPPISSIAVTNFGPGANHVVAAGHAQLEERDAGAG